MANSKSTSKKNVKKQETKSTKATHESKITAFFSCKKCISALVIILALCIGLGWYFYSQADSFKMPCDETIPQNEQDICMYEYSVNNSAPAGCGMISDIKLEEACLAQVGIDLQQSEICVNLSEQAAGRCLKVLATDLNDSSLCPGIESQTWRDSCYNNMSFNVPDYKLCNKITYMHARHDCFYDHAQNNKEFEKCNFVQNVSQQTKCKLNIAIDTKNVSLCNSIPGETALSRCFLHFALELNNSEYCTQIKSSLIRTDCLAKFNITDNSSVIILDKPAFN